MPSVSEPFGIVALEAMQNGTPVIASKQSGVAEVSSNMVTVDFWDTQAMSAAVLDLIRHPRKARKLQKEARHDLENLSWQDSAKTLQAVYQGLLRPAGLLPTA